MRAQLESLREEGITLAFAGLKHQILQAMRNTGLLDKIGEENLYPDERRALERLRAQLAATS